jgi:Lamin Tail Domain
MKPLTTLVAAMALALATAGTAQAGVQLSKILPYPAVVPGDQNAQVNAEYIVVKNTASRAKSIRGWYIREKKFKRTFTFPAFTLCGGCSVTIHSGHGTNSATNLYWGRASGAWVDSGDTAILHRASGPLQGTCVYPKVPAGSIPPPPTPDKSFGC